MSQYTISSLPRITSSELRSAILETSSSNLDAQIPSEKLAVIDVRDDDHIGGHIKHSIHAPSSTLDHKIPELVRKLKDKEVVVFHCALSQQRGPSAALRYLRERDRLLALTGAGTGTGEALKKSKVEADASEDKKDEDGEWEDVKGEKEKKEQKVYVLDRGFVGWQETYANDPRLTEGYRKEIWENGY